MYSVREALKRLKGRPLSSKLQQSAIMPYTDWLISQQASPMGEMELPDNSKSQMYQSKHYSHIDICYTDLMFRTCLQFTLTVEELNQFIISCLENEIKPI